ncbi:MAG TPA: glutathione S-transferase family protein, partial [Pseudomonadales bacterium]|nr:glutathione S-transferase family protein [Pseudomonadales bacterium]
KSPQPSRRRLMIKVHGHPLSPFVRKVLLTLEYKGVEYELNLVMPSSTEPEFRKISPLGKIPVLEHDGFTVPDSSVICRYLDRQFPERPIYPGDPKLEAQATWIEEYVDSKVISAFGMLFQQRFVNPNLIGKPTDEAVVNSILKDQVPGILAYLESIVPAQGVLVGDAISIADIAVTSAFVQGQYGQFEVGSEPPRLRAYLDRAFGSDIVKARLAAEKQLLGG